MNFDSLVHSETTAWLLRGTASATACEQKEIVAVMAKIVAIVTAGYPACRQK